MSSLYLLPSANPLSIEGGNTEETCTQEEDTAKYITERKGEGKGLGKGEGGKGGRGKGGRGKEWEFREIRGERKGKWREGRKRVESYKYHKNK